MPHSEPQARRHEWRESLKQATDPMHRRLDRRFAAFDLSSPDGYTAFLRAHLAAANAYQPLLARFCAEELDGTFPDYSNILARELAEWPAEREMDPPELAGPKGSAAGLAYTVLGSRLGATFLHRQHAGRLQLANPRASLSFLAEGDGTRLWKALLAWSRARAVSERQRDADIAGAKAGFDLFFAAADAVDPERETHDAPD